MVKVQLTKKEADRIMKMEDRTKGVVLKTLEEYILNKKGKEGLGMVEKRLKELGYPLKFKEISSYKLYQGPIDVLLTLVILDAFQWDESEAFNMGYDSLVVHSLSAKLLMSRFISIETAIKNAPKFWHYFSNLGEIKFPQYNIDKGSAIMYLEGYKKFHPAEYSYIRGVLTKIIEIMSKSKNVKVEQTKSLFKGDSYDEFKITWV